MKRFFVATFLVMGIAATGRADDGSAKRALSIKKMMDAQAAALIASDGSAFDKTVAADALDERQQDLMGPRKITIGTPKIGWVGTCGWAAAETKMRASNHPEMMADGAPELAPWRVWHWMALVEPDGTAFKTKAIGLFVTTPDKSLADGEYNDIAELPAEASPSALVAWLAKPSAMADHLASDPATTVFGTSASDRAFGPAAAKKLLKSWSKLTLDVVKSKPGEHRYDSHEVTVGDCTAASAFVRMKLKDGGSILLQAFAIARKLGEQWELVAVEYATDRTY
jgi:hypothetical protein